VGKNDKPQPNWNAILQEHSPLLTYWYRQSPRQIMATDFGQTTLTPGVVTITDPPPMIAGMASVRMDAQGRLLRFLGVPPEKEDGRKIQSAVDWTPLFASAGLDPAELHSTEPVWTTVVASDTRVAWDGKWPGTTRPLHVEAAAFHGKPVYFALMGP